MLAKTDATNRSKRQPTGELICPTGKKPSHAKTCPPLRAKIFRFAFAPNQTYSLRCPGPQEGRIAIVTDVGQGMRWTHIAERSHCADERRLCGRRSRVVLALQRRR